MINMNSKQEALKFLLTIFIILAGGYFLHRFLLNTYFDKDLASILKFSYKFNGGITILFTLTIILLSKKFKDQLGFLFMAGGFLKISLFLIWSKLQNQALDKSYLLTFFIPYAVCLIVEIYFVSRILNRINYKKDK